jgi:hypothetical protein
VKFSGICQNGSNRSGKGSSFPGDTIPHALYSTSSTELVMYNVNRTFYDVRGTFYKLYVTSPSALMYTNKRRKI